MARNIKDYLEPLLNVFWLRPETALWRCFDCLYMEAYGEVSGRSADLGCGDGVMSFIMGGGTVEDFDVFPDVTDLKKYNEGADIYDCTSKQTLKIDNSRLRYNYNWGLDHKQNLILKAKRFSTFYENTLTHDLNEPLPSEIDGLDSIFSNVLYWLDEPSNTLSDWNSKLVSGGKLMLLVPNSNFKDKAWLYFKAPHYGEHKYLNYFDRGYASLVKHFYDTETWLKIFEQSGFGLVTHKQYLTEPVMNIWNIGTRPISPLLINMANKLKSEDLKEIKKEWVDYFLKFFTPIVEGEFVRQSHECETAFHYFLLEKI